MKLSVEKIEFKICFLSILLFFCVQNFAQAYTTLGDFENNISITNAVKRSNNETLQAHHTNKGSIFEDLRAEEIELEQEEDSDSSDSTSHSTLIFLEHCLLLCAPSLLENQTNLVLVKKHLCMF